MQTFLPFADFRLSAQSLDNKRLNKQIIEATQILDILLLKKKYYCSFCKLQLDYSNNFKGFECIRSYPVEDSKKLQHDIKQTAWYNHPAVVMWRGYAPSLYDYTQKMIVVANIRGIIVKKSVDKMVNNYLPAIVESDTTNPWWLGIEEFHQSHRANLLRKNYEHYSKQGFTGDLTTPYWWPNASTKLQWELKQKLEEKNNRKTKTILLLNEDIRNSL